METVNDEVIRDEMPMGPFLDKKVPLLMQAPKPHFRSLHDQIIVLLETGNQVSALRWAGQRDKVERGRESGAVKRVRMQLMLFDSGRVDMPSPGRYCVQKYSSRYSRPMKTGKLKFALNVWRSPPGQLMEGWSRSEEVW